MTHKVQEQQEKNKQKGVAGGRERVASRWVRGQLTQSSVQVGLLLLLYTDRCCCGPDSTAACKQIG